MSPPMTSNTRSMPPTSSKASFSRSMNSCAPKSSAGLPCRWRGADDSGLGRSRKVLGDRG
jgi:hypothetical protein